MARTRSLAEKEVTGLPPGQSSPLAAALTVIMVSPITGAGRPKKPDAPIAPATTASARPPPAHGNHHPPSVGCGSGTPVSPAATRERMASATPVGSPGSATRFSVVRSSSSTSTTVILPPQSCSERLARAMQLGLHSSRRDAEALGDGLDRLVHQVMQRAHLALPQGQLAECRHDVHVERVHGIRHRLRVGADLGEGPPLGVLAAVLVADSIAGDDGDPGRDIGDRMRRGLRQEPHQRILHGVSGILPVAGDQAHGRDHLRVLVHDEVVQVYLDFRLRSDGHTCTTPSTTVSVDTAFPLAAAPPFRVTQRSLPSPRAVLSETRQRMSRRVTQKTARRRPSGGYCSLSAAARAVRPCTPSFRKTAERWYSTVRSEERRVGKEGGAVWGAEGQRN